MDIGEIGREKERYGPLCDFRPVCFDICEGGVKFLDAVLALSL